MKKRAWWTYGLCVALCGAVAFCAVPTSDAAIIRLKVDHELTDVNAYVLITDSSSDPDTAHDKAVRVLRGGADSTEFLVIRRRGAYQVEQDAILTLGTSGGPTLRVNARVVDVATGARQTVRNLKGTGSVKLASGQVVNNGAAVGPESQIIEYETAGELGGSPTGDLAIKVVLPWAK